MALENLQEDFFKSIDTIVQSRIANLPYDKTLECEIIEVSDSTKNIYKVSYQNVSFEAISTIKDLSPGDVVYVQIPQNDFTRDKIIVALKNNNTTQDIKILPFLRFIKGNNLISNMINQSEFNLELNSNKSSERHFTLVRFEGKDIAYGYTRMGIKATFNAGINTALVSGDYGIKITIHGYNQREQTKSRDTLLSMVMQQSSSSAFYKDFYLKKEDMVGTNLYNTKGFQNQEKVFDISGWVIDSIVVSLWQDNNFKDAHGNSIKNKYIAITNLQLYLGYDIDQVQPYGKPTLICYTADGLLYDPADALEGPLRKEIEFKVIQRMKNSNTFIDVSSSWLTIKQAINENTNLPIVERYIPSSKQSSQYSLKQRYEEIEQPTWITERIDDSLARLIGIRATLNPDQTFVDPIQNGFCYSFSKLMDQNFVTLVQTHKNTIAAERAEKGLVSSSNPEDYSSYDDFLDFIDSIVESLKSVIEIDRTTKQDVINVITNKKPKTYFSSNELWFVHKDHQALLDNLLTVGVEQVIEDETIISGSLIYSGSEFLFKSDDGTVLIRLNTDESQFFGTATEALNYKINGNIYNNFVKIKQVLDTLAPNAYTIE